MNKPILYGAIGGLAFALIVLLYLYQVTNLMKHDQITAKCTNTDAINYTRQAQSTFGYVLNPSNWATLGQYMNATCLAYQNATKSLLMP